MPQEKIELTRVRTFGEIIEDSIQFFKQTWRPLLKSYFTICGVFWVAGLIVAIFNASATLEHRARGESILSLSYFLSMAYDMFEVVLITLTLLSFIALYKEKGNEPPEVQEVWGYVKYFFLRVFGSYIALATLTIAGVVCCFIPGIYFMVVFSLTLPIMVMENSTLGYAFNRSFKIIKENWWFTFGIIIVTALIIYATMFSVVIPVVIVSYITNFLSTTNILTVYSYSLAIIVHLAQFFYFLPVIGITLTYFSLTEAKDDGTLLQRIMNLGSQSKAPEQPLTEEY